MWKISNIPVVTSDNDTVLFSRFLKDQRSADSIHSVWNFSLLSSALESTVDSSDILWNRDKIQTKQGRERGRKKRKDLKELRTSKMPFPALKNVHQQWGQSTDRQSQTTWKRILLNTNLFSINSSIPISAASRVAQCWHAYSQLLLC